jgi:hypothetical protein
MSDSTQSKYNSDFRKRLVAKIENLNDTNHYTNIFHILDNAGVKYNYNSNGVFLNMSKLPDSAILAVIKYLNQIENPNLKNSKENYEYVPYTKDDIYNKIPGPKLSNLEKRIIKRKNIQEFVDQEENNQLSELEIGTIVSDGDSERSNSKNRSDRSKSSSSSKSKETDDRKNKNKCKSPSIGI